MTLISDAFVATPSIINDAPVVSDRRSSYKESSSVVRSTAVDGSTQTPSQVLAMTIRKKRKLLRRRERNLRVEILLTSTIRHLCQEISDHLRTRRLASSKRKTTDSDASSTTTVRSCSDMLGRVEEHADEAVRNEKVVLPDLCSQARDSVSSNEPVEDCTIPSSGRISQLKRKTEFNEDSVPCKRVPDSFSTDDTFNEKDPFGLDDFFRSLKTCRVGTSQG